MPAVCRFYLKGYCRYGRNCRFEHPGESYYEQEDTSHNKSSNFSFKAALTEIGGQSNTGFAQSSFSPFQQTSHNTFGNTTTSGFSFTNAFQSIRGNTIQNIDDVDMSADVVQHHNNLPGSNLFSTSYFGNQVQTRPQIQSQVSFSQQQVPSATTTTTQNPDFSKITDLDEAELRAYERNTFEFRSIPIRPPPQELCRT